MNALRHAPVSLQEALERAPALARLSQMIAQSALQLRIVQPALPAALRPLVRPGPIDEAGWCLLVPHGAAAAKLRQLIPALLAELQAAGHPVGAIRVRIARSPSLQTPS